jgi:hypothetical protein
VPTKPWREALVDPTVTDAICDHLCNNTHVLELGGPSICRNKARQFEKTLNRSGVFPSGRLGLRSGATPLNHTLAQMVYQALGSPNDIACRSAPERFGTGHDLNDGALIISPLANGGRLLGGIDPDTGITYGFDPASGGPDGGRQMTEAEIYAGMAQSLGVSLDGVTLPDMRAMRRIA